MQAGRGFARPSESVRQPAYGEGGNPFGAAKKAI